MLLIKEESSQASLIILRCLDFLHEGDSNVKYSNSVASRITNF